MQDSNENLFLRNDTILGICEAVGQDLGINSNLLRVTLCALLFVDPAITIGSYLALGVVVAATRWAFPRSKAAAPATDQAPVAAAAANEQSDLQIAA